MPFTLLNNLTTNTYLCLAEAQVTSPNERLKKLLYLNLNKRSHANERTNHHKPSDGRLL